jgi:hypothetical protein
MNIGKIQSDIRKKPAKKKAPAEEGEVKQGRDAAWDQNLIAETERMDRQSDTSQKLIMVDGKLVLKKT